MPQTDSSLRLCTCARCSAVNPEGRYIPRRTYFWHKANQDHTRIPGPKFRCTYCPDKHPDGHLVSYPTFLAHKEKARAATSDQLQQPSSVDSVPLPHSASQPVSVQFPNSYPTPIRPHIGDRDHAIGDAMDEAIDEAVGDTINDAMDDTFHGDGTDECAHSSIDRQTGSTDEEFDTGIQDDETIEQLFSTHNDILMEDEADELDCNSDDDNASDHPDINPSIDDLAFVRLARLRSKGMSREIYEEFRQTMRMFKIELPSLHRFKGRLQRWTKIDPKLLDCCVNSCIAYTGTFQDERICPHCNESRYSAAGQPRKQFLYIPVAHRLVLQYSDAGRARVLKSYRQTYSNQSDDAGRRQLRDIFDGALYHDFHLQERGMFRDPHDVALHLSLDGVQLTNMRNHEV